MLEQEVLAMLEASGRTKTETQKVTQAFVRFLLYFADVGVEEYSQFPQPVIRNICHPPHLSKLLWSLCDAGIAELATELRTSAPFFRISAAR